MLLRLVYQPSCTSTVIVKVQSVLELSRLTFRNFSFKQESLMALKMNAAVVEEFGKPLVLREREIPSPAAGQILIKTEACGVCHTDLHAAHGDWPVKPTLPFIPGHSTGSSMAMWPHA